MAYWTGVALAILSGASQNLGLVWQKKAVNELTDQGIEARFFSALVRKPLWVAGLVAQMVVGSALFLTAQALIGPALVPGLMAVGLVVLILGSIRIVGEAITLSEAAGIVGVIAAVALIGSSRLAIDVARYDVTGRAFLLRAAAFLLCLLLIGASLTAVRARRPAAAGVCLSLESGVCFALSNFCVGPFVGVALRLVGGALTPTVISLFATCCALLVAANVLGIGRIQRAFRHCPASRAVPMQQGPVQLAPPLVYLVVFRLPVPSAWSLAAFCAGVALILAGSWVLARRQARLQGTTAR